MRIIETEMEFLNIAEIIISQIRNKKHSFMHWNFSGVWNSNVDVAVKMLKPGSMSKESFLEESQIMKKCRHKNLVRLYAVCSITEPILIVTELMCNGSLLEYLRADKNVSLSFLQLIDFAAQVSNKRIISRLTGVFLRTQIIFFYSLPIEYLKGST